MLLGRLLSLLRGIALGLPAYTFLAVSALIIRLTLAVLIRGIGLIRILFLRLLISRCGTTPSSRPPVARATSAAGAVGLAFPTLLRSTRTATATLRAILSLAAVTISLVSITTLRSTAGAAIRAF